MAEREVRHSQSNKARGTGLRREVRPGQDTSIYKDRTLYNVVKYPESLLVTDCGEVPAGALYTGTEHDGKVLEGV